MRLTRNLAVAIILLAVAQDSGAHARSESYSTWWISGTEVRGEITVAAADVMALAGADNTLEYEQLFVEHVRSTVSFLGTTSRCNGPDSRPLSAARGFVRIELKFHCGSERPDALRYRALIDTEPAHVHFARIFADDTPDAEALFTDRAPEWRRDATNLAPTFVAFLDVGLRHILAGVDHIAFLLGLVLVSGSVWRGVTAVTGFTLGHSLSLGAAVLGVVQADGRLIEAFIGFTVALLAVEFFLRDRQRGAALALAAPAAAWGVGVLAVALGVVSVLAGLAYLGFGIFAFCYLRASHRLAAAGGGPVSVITLFVATCCFGIIHGFGFAGFLMETGVEGGALLAPLLGFNVGVELGQLALLAAAVLLLRALRNLRLQLLAPLTAAGLCGLGVFWFVSRSLSV